MRTWLLSQKNAFKLLPGLGSTAALWNQAGDMEGGWTHQNLFSEFLATEIDRPRGHLGLGLPIGLFSVEPEPVYAISLKVLVAFNHVINFNHVCKANETKRPVQSGVCEV